MRSENCVAMSDNSSAETGSSSFPLVDFSLEVVEGDCEDVIGVAGGVGTESSLAAKEDFGFDADGGEEEG